MGDSAFNWTCAFFTRRSTLIAPSVGASDLGAGTERQENEAQRERERERERERKRRIKVLDKRRVEKGTSASRVQFALTYTCSVFHSFARKRAHAVGMRVTRYSRKVNKYGQR